MDRQLCKPTRLLRISNPARVSCHGTGSGARKRSPTCVRQASPLRSLHASRHTLLRDQGPPHSWSAQSLRLRNPHSQAEGGSLSLRRLFDPPRPQPRPSPGRGAAPPPGTRNSGPRASRSPDSAPDTNHTDTSFLHPHPSHPLSGDFICICISSLANGETGEARQTSASGALARIAFVQLSAGVGWRFPVRRRAVVLASKVEAGNQTQSPV